MLENVFPRKLRETFTASRLSMSNELSNDFERILNFFFTWNKKLLQAQKSSTTKAFVLVESNCKINGQPKKLTSSSWKSKVRS